MHQPLSGAFYTGLRARLLAIVLLAIAPMAVMLFVYAGSQNNATQDRARTAVQSQLDASVGSLQDLVAESRATLVTFGITYAIQARDWVLVQGNADRLRAENPEYAVIAVADAAGRIRASSPRASGSTDISDEPLFQRAVSSRRLVVSDYQKDPITGRPSVGVGLPVYDGKDRLIAVEYIAFDPSQFGKRLLSGAGTVITLIDDRGTVIARRPVSRAIEGTAFPESALVKTALLTDKKGQATASGLDGVSRDYYFAPVFSNGEGTQKLIVGFSPTELLADQRRAFATLMAAFGFFSVASLVAAWLFGTYSIYRPTLLLQSAAGRLSRGDLGARVDVGNRHDELGSLGHSFNNMAETLQHHVDELQKARAELSALNVALEERVRRRTAELEASNKELEAFSYSVSHDLRSPLRAIDGFSLALLEDYSDVLDDQGRDDLQRVRDNATRMGELIDSLLKLSRLSRQEMDIHDVDLSRLATEVAESLREADPEREVDVRIAPGVRAPGDPAMLRIVLENLIGNAWKFTSKRESAIIEFGSSQSDEETAYFVRDNGAGFDMAYSNKLFGAFQRIHGQTEFPGIGIGLATTARIVRRLGGRIWAEGVPEEGATFFFTLR